MVRRLAQRKTAFHCHGHRFHEFLPWSGSKHSPCQLEAGEDTGHGDGPGVDEGGHAPSIIHGYLSQVGLAGKPEPRVRHVAVDHDGIATRHVDGQESASPRCADSRLGAHGGERGDDGCVHNRPTGGRYQTGGIRDERRRSGYGNSWHRLRVGLLTPPFGLSFLHERRYPLLHIDCAHGDRLRLSFPAETLRKARLKRRIETLFGEHLGYRRPL